MNRDAIDFENGHIPELFRKLLIPTLLGAIAISLVTVIDGIFIGQGVGPHGVAAVNIIVPIFQIMAGIGFMIGMGCSVTVSIHLAQQKIKIANIHITQALLISSLFSALFCIIVWVFPENTAQLLGASESLTPDVIDYLIWIVPCFMFQMWAMIGLFIIRLDGAPRVAMWCNVIPAVLNGVLDWVFIFPLDMGVKGAAIATMMSISIGGIMALGYLLFFSNRLHPIIFKFSPKSIRLMVRNIVYQCRIGLSSLLGEMTLAIFVFIGNQVFMRYLGDDGVGAFGIACYYMPFFFMIGNGIAQSAQPIISYNYAMMRWDHIDQTRRLLLGSALVCGMIVTVAFLFFPVQLVGLFIDIHSSAGQIAIQGLPYFSIGVIFFILNIAWIGYHQSIEQIRAAMAYVFLRGGIVLIPAFILLPIVLGVKGIWLAMPAAEILTFIIIILNQNSGSGNYRNVKAV